MLEQKVRDVLETRVRPLLALHRGGAEFVSCNVRTGVVLLRFTGMCVGCPAAQMTLKGGVEAILKENIPAVSRVEAAE